MFANCTGCTVLPPPRGGLHVLSEHYYIFERTLALSSIGHEMKTHFLNIASFLTPDVMVVQTSSNIIKHIIQMFPSLSWISDREAKKTKYWENNTLPRD